MNTLQKKKLRGTGVNCGLIVLLFAVVLLLGQVLPDNTYRRVLVPIIWQMCIFILLGTSLNLTLGYLGQLTLGHMGFAGIGAYTAALSSLALERAGVSVSRRTVNKYREELGIPARAARRRS